MVVHLERAQALGPEEIKYNVAALTGESLTAAITEALRERLERVRHASQGDLARRLLSIGRECAARMHGPWIDHAELLYDERGLP